MQRLGEKCHVAETTLEQRTAQAQMSIEAATEVQDQRATEIEEMAEKHLKALEEMKAGEKTLKDTLTKESQTLQEKAGRMGVVKEEMSEKVEGVTVGLKELEIEFDSSYQTQSEMVMTLSTHD